jgi:hypothetical protein
MIDDWRDVLDLGYHIIAVFLDLSKAFDTIDHQLLLKKLSYYNLDFSFIELMSNYLTNRFIQVKINGELSKKERIKVGIPQGSVLGPLLFIVYINDLAHLPLRSKLLLFADDTTVYLSGLNISEIINNLSNDLSIIKNWLVHNRLVLNLEKTNAIHFNSKNRKIDYKNYTLKCDNNNIEFVTETKLLGVIIDNKLKYSSHINQLCKKANAKAYLLTRSLYLFPNKFRPLLFKLFIMPHFDYCSSLFLHIRIYDRDRLTRCFNKCIYRLLKIDIYNLSEFEQFKLLFDKFKIFPFLYRQLYHFSSFLYKLIVKNDSIIVKNLPVSSATTRFYYKLPEIRTDFKKFSFKTISVKILNLFLYNYIKKNKNDRTVCIRKEKF